MSESAILSYAHGVFTNRSFTEPDSSKHINMSKSHSKHLNSPNLQPDEYGAFYSRYIDKSKGANLLDILDDSRKKLKKLLQRLSEEQAEFRYADGKWSVKEVVGHMTDTERIMNYRALTFARGDSHELPGFDQNSYVEAANFSDLPLANLLAAYNAVRSSTIALFSSFTDDMLLAKGSASGSEFSVRALGFVIAGHEIHHLEILREKYLPYVSAG